GVAIENVAFALEEEQRHADPGDERNVSVDVDPIGNAYHQVAGHSPTLQLALPEEPQLLLQLHQVDGAGGRFRGAFRDGAAHEVIEDKADDNKSQVRDAP